MAEEKKEIKGKGLLYAHCNDPKYKIKIKTVDGIIHKYEAYDAGWWDRYYRVKLANEILYFPVYNIVWVSKENESEEEPVNLEKES